MVKKLGILGFILVVVAATGMAWAGTYGAVMAPQPTVMPAAAPACVGANCPPPVAAKVKCAPKKLVTTIQVKMSYPKPPMPPMACAPPGCGMGPPPIPVAVPMWKFIVPWPPYVYYLPVE
jgi:hypothetical protein